MSEKNSTYFKRGVSYSKSDIHQAIQGLDKGLFPNAFCKILPDIAHGDPEFCNIMHADTAGTKTSLAYLYWKETGDLSVWDGIVQDAIVMNLDDMACSGFVSDIILSSTVGRNKHLIPKEVSTRIIRAGFEFIEKMAEMGIQLHHAGGETADVGDIVRTVDVGYTAFARLERTEVVNNQIRPGDVIVGLASYGQSTYEEEYNGGMGSNGLTSARHDLFHHSYREKYPESYDPNTERSLIYSGGRRVTDPIDIGSQTVPLGKLVLSPTRTYLPVIHRAFQAGKEEISGVIHCTGGAQTKVLKFLDKPVHIVKDKLLEIPPLFRIIGEEAGVDRKEMYPVFNMGHRLEFYVRSESKAQEIIEMSQSFDIDAQIIGRVESSNEPLVTISDDKGTYEYK